jgi:hypothetical protein
MQLPEANGVAASPCRFHTAPEGGNRRSLVTTHAPTGTALCQFADDLRPVQTCCAWIGMGPQWDGRGRPSVLHPGETGGETGLEKLAWRDWPRLAETGPARPAGRDLDRPGKTPAKTPHGQTGTAMHHGVATAALLGMQRLVGGSTNPTHPPPRCGVRPVRWRPGGSALLAAAPSVPMNRQRGTGRFGRRVRPHRTGHGRQCAWPVRRAGICRRTSRTRGAFPAWPSSRFFRYPGNNGVQPAHR